MFHSNSEFAYHSKISVDLRLLTTNSRNNKNSDKTLKYPLDKSLILSHTDWGLRYKRVFCSVERTTLQLMFY